MSTEIGSEVVVSGVSVPRLLYGTAWKEEETPRLTQLAIEAGFRGIDTANQRRHYVESAVGDALAVCYEKGIIDRDRVFLQTKFTFARGQDHRIPYDPAADQATQVMQSFESSLEHLRTSRVDSYVLHGPSTGHGLTAADRETWRAMESLHAGGRVRSLGVSNVNLDQLRELCEVATVRPSFVQNRCFASRWWDREIREFCRHEGIVYQGFSLLTGNQRVLAHPDVLDVAERLERTPEQVVLRFGIQAGMIVLTGTTDPIHMREDLGIFEFELDPEVVDRIETVAER